MAKPVIPAHSSVKLALREIISAHEAIIRGIATHAEKHVVMIDARREEVRRADAIKQGIERHSGKV